MKKGMILATLTLSIMIFGITKVKAATTKFEEQNVTVNNSSMPYSFNNSANGNYTTSISVMWNATYEEQNPYDHPNILIEACTTGAYTPTNYSIVRTYAPGTSCPNSCFQQQVTYFQTDQQCPAGNGTYIGKKLYILLKSQKWNIGSGNTPYYTITDSITFKSQANYATITTIYGIYMTDDNFADQIQNATNETQLNILTSTIHSDNQAIISAVGGLAGNINSQTSTIINEDTNYNNNASENIEGKQEMDDYADAESELLEDLDFSGAEDIDITINAEASTFIWQIVEQLRQMNGAIVLLVTSILGLGIIKMILNR